MLDEKLEEAKQENAQKRQKLFIILTLVVAGCAIIIAGFSLFYAASKSNTEATIPLPEAEQISPELLDQAREEFKQKLKIHENEIEPYIEVAYLENWNKEAAFAIKDFKAKAISYFSEGNYPEALVFLEKLDAKAKAIFNEREQLFSEQLELSQRHYDQGDYDQAKLYIDKALNIDPVSQEAILLQQKIENLPDVLFLLNEVRVARTENNLAKELILLTQLQQLEPGRQGTGQRIAELSEMLKEMAFKEHVSAAFANIDRKNAKQARANYKKAKDIFPDRDEIGILHKQLMELESHLSFQAAVASADKFIRKDDWIKAKTYFEKAAKYAPANATVVQGLARADQVLQLKNAFTEYEKNPYRLSNSHYRKKAEDNLLLAEEAGKFSFSLLQQAKRVSTLIHAMGQKKEVSVASDNQTFVQVRGIGKIGKTAGKVIWMRPGNYTFEGMREGYKTKLVKVLVPYDKNKINVKVICDEPI